ncbi:MAG TPA: MFS transporter [Candidatus Saccharimonadales bacterium]|nr:MFS transporter [Candidatus Saccharimonadales bacterium]
MTSDQSTANPQPWYAGVTRYQWLILIIASAGWIFDVYEGQIFNITSHQLLQSVLGTNDPHAISFWNDVFLGVFLLGGATGGLLFGMMADYWGRKPTMVATILMYSIFSGLTFFAHSLWHIGVLRFLVAMGTGGEWAVAASLVAEVFPAHARTHASGIFHATSVSGTWIATATGLIVASQWRYAYLFGILPALLVAWVMASVKEPPRWQKAAEEAPAQAGSLRELLGDPRWRKRALLGMLLAAIGLGNYWAVHVAGQSLAVNMLVKNGVKLSVALEKGKWAYGFVETVGGLAGLLCFGPLCARIGRKPAFFWSYLAAFLIVPVTCYLPQTFRQLLFIFPIFGFLTLGMHAGYAIYFPELFPTRLRATGTGFCFNVGRVAAASMLVFSGWLKNQLELHLAITLLGCFFLLGLVVVHYLPETKGQPLPE